MGKILFQVWARSGKGSFKSSLKLDRSLWVKIKRQNILGGRNRVSKGGKVESVGPGWGMAKSLARPQCHGLAG